MENKLPVGRFSKTKIVATIGPACDSLDRLTALITAGVDVFRLNMAHGQRREHEVRLASIRQAMEQTGQFVAVLADLAGPKIRLGELPGGQMDCHAGAIVRFVRGSVAMQPQDLTTTYEPLVDELAVGDRVMLADGTVSLVVEERGNGFRQMPRGSAGLDPQPAGRQSARRETERFGARARSIEKTPFGPHEMASTLSA